MGRFSAVLRVFPPAAARGRRRALRRGPPSTSSSVPRRSIRTAASTTRSSCWLGSPAGRNGSGSAARSCSCRCTADAPGERGRDAAGTLRRPLHARRRDGLAQGRVRPHGRSFKGRGGVRTRRSGLASLARLRCRTRSPREGATPGAARDPADRATGERRGMLEAGAEGAVVQVTGEAAMREFGRRFS